MKRAQILDLSSMFGFLKQLKQKEDKWIRNGELSVGILTWQKKAPKIGRPGQFLNPGDLLSRNQAKWLD